MTRHHLVPQLYLRRFADSKKQICLVDRDDLSSRTLTTAKQAVHENDFYGWNPGLSPDDVDDPALLDPEHIEKLLCVLRAERRDPSAESTTAGFRRHRPRTATT